MKKRIAILASGSGSNAESILKASLRELSFEVVLIISNRNAAFVLKRAEDYGVCTAVFSNKDFAERPELIIEALQKAKVDVIVLAGFLRKVPALILHQYQDQILNIHPSLLPHFGGKGMYGKRVHEAVINAKSKRSGMTIHLVNEDYDKGRILFQASCLVLESDNAEDLAKRVLELEHRYYPEVIDYFCSQSQ